MKRRDFIKSSAITGGSVALLPAACAPPREGAPRSAGGADKDVASADRPFGTGEAPLPSAGRHKLPDLSPARWVWYPSGRTLANTFVLFRRELDLKAAPRRATGWIHADSRYQLEVNGRRVQWGPAPSDPRWPEADPLDLTAALVPGPNVIGVRSSTTATATAPGRSASPVFSSGWKSSGPTARLEQARLRLGLGRAPGPRLAAGPIQALVSALAPGGVRRPTSIPLAGSSPAFTKTPLGSRPWRWKDRPTSPRSHQLRGVSIRTTAQAPPALRAASPQHTC